MTDQEYVTTALELLNLKRAGIITDFHGGDDEVEIRRGDETKFISWGEAQGITLGMKTVEELFARPIPPIPTHSHSYRKNRARTLRRALQRPVERQDDRRRQYLRETGRTESWYGRAEQNG